MVVAVAARMVRVAVRDSIVAGVAVRGPEVQVAFASRGARGNVCNEGESFWVWLSPYLWVAR